MMMLDSIILYWWSIICQWWYCGSNKVYVVIHIFVWREVLVQVWIVGREVLLRYPINWIMSCACHESFAFWSYVMILWSDRTGTHLASYVARGGVRCGFKPSEVWRQKSCIAFICINRSNKLQMLMKLSEYTNLCGCSRRDGIWYMNLWIL